MAGAPAGPAEPPLQYWLDVARPIQPRRLRERVVGSVQARSALPPVSPQMELRMVAASPAPPAPRPVPSADGTASPGAPFNGDLPVPEARRCFVAWLRDQGKKGGAIGELAKAARLDPLFPRRGSAEDVRARFARAGADGDAFAALEDAELDYDRCG